MNENEKNKNMKKEGKTTWLTEVLHNALGQKGLQTKLANKPFATHSPDPEQSLMHCVMSKLLVNYNPSRKLIILFHS